MANKKLMCMDCKFCRYILPIECYCKLKKVDLATGGYLKASRCPAYQPKFWTRVKAIFGYYGK